MLEMGTRLHEPIPQEVWAQRHDATKPRKWPQPSGHKCLVEAAIYCACDVARACGLCHDTQRGFRCRLAQEFVSFLCPDFTYMQNSDRWRQRASSSCELHSQRIEEGC